MGALSCCSPQSLGGGAFVLTNLEPRYQVGPAGQGSWWGLCPWGLQLWGLPANATFPVSSTAQPGSLHGLGGTRGIHAGSVKVSPHQFHQ